MAEGIPEAMKPAAAAALILFCVLTLLAGDDVLAADPRAHTLGAGLLFALGIAALAGMLVGAASAVCWVLRARVPTPAPTTIALLAVTLGLALAAPVRTYWPTGEFGVGAAGAIPLLDAAMLLLGFADDPRFPYDRTWFYPSAGREIPQWEPLGIALAVTAAAALGAATAAIVRNTPRPIDRADARRRLQRIVFFIEEEG
jgi:hypothetical protein